MPPFTCKSPSLLHLWGKDEKDIGMLGTIFHLISVKPLGPFNKFFKLKYIFPRILAWIVIWALVLSLNSILQFSGGFAVIYGAFVLL